MPRPSVLLLLAFAMGCGGGGERDEEALERNALDVRKPVYELTPADLEKYPIWEHALDEEGQPGQDEATVRPRPDLDAADPAEGEILARVELVARDGTRFVGYAYPSFDDDPASTQPTIVTERGQVNFWYGAFAPEPDELARNYTTLQRTAAELFPLRYRSTVASRGKLAGTIPAFRHFRSPSDQRVVEVR